MSITTNPPKKEIPFLNRYIIAIREWRGLSRIELAKLMGYTPGHIKLIEEGKAEIRWFTFERICTAMGCVPAISIEDAPFERISSIDPMPAFLQINSVESMPAVVRNKEHSKKRYHSYVKKQKMTVRYLAAKYGI